MAITQAMCTSFKAELLLGVHDFRPSADTGADVFKLALYTNAATLNAQTTAYTTAGEASGGNYAAGGQVVTATLSSGTNADQQNVVYVDFSSPSWTGAITARGALIYKAGANGAVCVLDFGSDKTSTDGDFTIIFPTNDASNAIIRIA